MKEWIRIGIDLGGTKIEGLALDEAGAEIARLRVATPQHDYAATVRAIAEVVQELERRVGSSVDDRGAASVGVGIPGTIVHATGLVKNANSTWMNGQPLQRDLAAAVGRPVRCANDANCLAVSEATEILRCDQDDSIRPEWKLFFGCGSRSTLLPPQGRIVGVLGLAGDFVEEPAGDRRPLPGP